LVVVGEAPAAAAVVTEPEPAVEVWVEEGEGEELVGREVMRGG